MKHEKLNIRKWMKNAGLQINAKSGGHHNEIEGAVRFESYPKANAYEMHIEGRDSIMFFDGKIFMSCIRNVERKAGYKLNE